MLCLLDGSKSWALPGPLSSTGTEISHGWETFTRHLWGPTRVMLSFRKAGSEGKWGRWTTQDLSGLPFTWLLDCEHLNLLSPMLLEGCECLGMRALSRIGGKATDKQWTVQRPQGWQRLAAPLLSHLARLALRNPRWRMVLGHRRCQLPRAGSLTV